MCAWQWDEESEVHTSWTTTHQQDPSPSVVFIVPPVQQAVHRIFKLEFKRWENCPVQGQVNAGPWESALNQGKVWAAPILHLALPENGSQPVGLPLCFALLGMSMHTCRLGLAGLCRLYTEGGRNYPWACNSLLKLSDVITVHFWKIFCMEWISNKLPWDFHLSSERNLIKI